jgi:hypothetical protein
MNRVRTWMRAWWGEDERQVNLNEYLGLPARHPHWSAKVVRYVIRELSAGKELPWFQRPFGIVLLAVAGAGMAKALGWI